MNYLKIGFIKKPHGLKGELKVLPLTDNIKRFLKLKKVLLLINDNFIEYNISNIKVSREEVIIRFENFNTLNDVESFRNVYIYVDRNDAVPCNDWEFYSQDLIDCNVFFNGEHVGKVIDLVNSGANDNLIILKDGTEIYYPFVREFIKSIDLGDKKIEILQMEGFFD